MRDNNVLQKNGSILVISVLIMSIMGMIVFGLSGIVIRMLEMSRNIDNSIMAYYGAESGIEAGLFAVRKQGRVVINESGRMNNNVKWRRTVIPSQDFASFKNIKKNNIIELDLYNLDDQTCSTPVIRCDWESMIIDWSGDAELSVTLTEWARSPFIDFKPESYSEKRIVGVSSPLIINDIKSDSNYRVKIKAFGFDANDVSINLYNDDDGGGEHVPVPNILTIIGSGGFGMSNKFLKTIIPRSDPLSSLYDYIIFSEEDIVKEF